MIDRTRARVTKTRWRARQRQSSPAKRRSRKLPPHIEEEDGSEVWLRRPLTAERHTRHRAQDCRRPRRLSTSIRRWSANSRGARRWARAKRRWTGPLPKRWRSARSCMEGTRVRLSGQDSGRGTFQPAPCRDVRHADRRGLVAALRVAERANKFAAFEVFDSSLSEQGVLGFEYGYSVIARDALVLWEAQFGDFGNGAQVIIDQYIAASEDKWKQHSRLTMLLPHGYEGQGPEHSSARLERYLQLCAENNMQVCYPTTPAQYFHLLRRQVKQETARPADRHDAEESVALARRCLGGRAILTSGGFRPVIDDAEVTDREDGAAHRSVQRQGLLRSAARRAKNPATSTSRSFASNSFIRSRKRRCAKIFASLPERDAARLDAGRAEEHGRLDIHRAALDGLAADVRAAILCRSRGLCESRDGIIRDTRA